MCLPEHKEIVGIRFLVSLLAGSEVWRKEFSRGKGRPLGTPPAPRIVAGEVVTVGAEKVLERPVHVQRLLDQVVS